MLPGASQSKPNPNRKTQVQRTVHSHSIHPQTKNPKNTVMKNKLTYSLLLAAASCGVALGQTTAYTTPVGYVTESLQPNRFNLLGITVQNPTLVAGVLDSATAISVTDAAVDFVAALTAGQKYVLEINNGSGKGTVQVISAWTATTLTTPDNISASITPNVTTYSVRKASTVSDIFGATNSAGLTATPDGDFSVVDQILILNDAGSFDTVYYVNDGAGTEGWFDADGLDAANNIIAYPDGFYVKRVAGSPISLVVSGEVKKVGTNGVLSPGFNYLGGVAPVGLTLGNSGLQNFITPTPDGDFSVVDNVLIPLPTGAFQTTYYVNDGAGTEGWFDADGLDASGVAITSGFLIQNRGVTKPYSLAVPTSYNSL